MYVHGLGDAQEGYAREDEMKLEWINSIEMKCPHCKSIDTDYEDMEEESDEYGIDTTFYCVCQGCGKDFVHTHYTDMS